MDLETFVKTSYLFLNALRFFGAAKNTSPQGGAFFFLIGLAAFVAAILFRMKKN